MGKLDLPAETVRKSADHLATKVALQNWCASGFPYCCEGEIRINEDGSASCDCGLGMRPQTQKDPHRPKSAGAS
jgi:hypothetical protein